MRPGFFVAVLVVSAAFLGVVFCMAARPSGALQNWVIFLGIASLVLSLMIPGLVPEGLKIAHRWRWLGLLLVPVLFIVGSRGGWAMRQILFQRDLPALQRVVDLVASGKLEIEGGRVVLPDSATAPVRSILARRDEANAALEVTFFVGGGFPVKHFAYVYRSDGRFPADRRRHWPKRRQRAEHWFEVSD